MGVTAEVIVDVKLLSNIELGRSRFTQCQELDLIRLFQAGRRQHRPPSINKYYFYCTLYCAKRKGENIKNKNNQKQSEDGNSLKGTGYQLASNFNIGGTHMLCFRRVLNLNTEAEHKIVLFAFVSQHLTQQNAWPFIKRVTVFLTDFISLLISFLSYKISV